MAPTGRTPPLSSGKERGSHPSSLDSSRRLQTEAMESQTTRRVGEFMGDVEVPNRRAVASPDGAMVSPHRASLRNVSSSYSMLEYTKRTQTEAVASRTAKRIGEIMGNSGKTSALSPVIQQASQNQSPPSYFEAMGNLPELNKGETPLQKKDTLVLPGPTVSRNITQRRSRGRSRDDEPMASVSSILARRPRSRSKDRRYSIESTTGFPVQDSAPDVSFVGSQDWRSARALGKPKTQPLPERTHVPDQHGTVRDGLRSPNPRLQSSDGASGGNGVFLKQLIPGEEVDPQLRAHLLELWDQRQAASVAMNMALNDDDEYHYGAYSDKFNQLNDEMHVVLRNNLGRIKDSPDGSGFTASLSSSSEAKQTHWRDVDSLPLVE